jgi:retron-type reverse transcriptase
VLLEILGENIQDNRFLRLVSNLLRAGYLEDWKLNATYSGTPQGGVVSPILANVYLDRLDKFVENVLIPPTPEALETVTGTAGGGGEGNDPDLNSYSGPPPSWPWAYNGQGTGGRYGRLW